MIIRQHFVLHTKLFGLHLLVLHIGYNKHHAVLDQKEIGNFERTLKILLQDSVCC